APTLAMNPTIPEAEIAREYERDGAVAAAEYGAEFRSDVEGFLSLDTIRACVIPDRRELPPMTNATYFGFCDPSGGSRDSMTLAIGHRENHIAVLDVIREAKPPFSPEAVVEDFCHTLKRYRAYEVTGDYYGGEWPKERFGVHDIRYRKAERNRSEYYL